MKLLKLATAVAAMFAVLPAAAPVWAQTSPDVWPSRSVSILVPTAAGGNTDIMARFAAEHLANKFGQPFVVQNRPSAGGVLTSQQVGTADPDGYTVLFAPSSMIVLTPLIQNVPFDPDNLVPVTNVGTGAQAVAVRKSLPVTTLAEFIAYAKANSGKLNYTTGGVNNISHLGPVLLFRRAGIELVHVAARGEPQAVTDLMSGSVDFYFGNTSVLLGSDLDKIRLLAVGTAQRLPGAPDLPTVAETIPGFEFASWNGFFVPKGTPDAIIEKLRGAIVELVASPTMKDRLTKLGIVPGGQSKEEVVATFKKDAASFSEAVAAAGIKKPEAK